MLPIIIAATFLSRILFLDQFPPSLNWDEASLGYNAYSILKSGRDEWGVAFPSIFRAFGDYKLPGYVYFSVLPTFLFGLSPISTRFTSALFGTILVFTTYYITKKMIGHWSLRIGHWAAILAALSPWSWFLSRIALEANLAASIFSVGLALYFSRLSPIVTTLFLTLPVWIYNSYRIFVPLFLIPLFFLRRSRISIITALIVLLPMFGQMLLSSGQARFKWVTILDSAAIGELEYLRNTSQSPYKNLFYNRYSYLIFHVSKNYLNHFNPVFLFTSGSTNYQFNIPNQGLIFLVFAPFFYLGIYQIFKHKNYFLIAWLLLAPIASSITKDSPHVLRSITFLPLPFILIAKSLSQIKSKILFVIILLLSLPSAICYLRSMSTYRNNYAWSFQYGTKQLSDYIVQHQTEYDEVLITKKSGEPHIFLLYYQKINPNDYRTDPNLNRYLRSDWYWVD